MYVALLQCDNLRNGIIITKELLWKDETECRGLATVVVLRKDPTHLRFVSLSPLVPLCHSTPQHTAQDRSDGGDHIEPHTTAGTVRIHLQINTPPYTVNTSPKAIISQTYGVHQSDQHPPEYVRSLGTNELQNRSVKEKAKAVQKYHFWDQCPQTVDWKC